MEDVNQFVDCMELNDRETKRFRLNYEWKIEYGYLIGMSNLSCDEQ